MVHSLSIKLREGTFMSQALKSLYELGQCLKLGKLPLPSFFEFKDVHFYTSFIQPAFFKLLV